MRNRGPADAAFEDTSQSMEAPITRSAEHRLAFDVV